MKNLLTILLLSVLSISSYGQARELLGRDTITHQPNKIIRDTAKTLKVDTTLKIVSTSPYETTIGVNPNILSSGGGQWQTSALYPTKIYTTFPYVGIGVDTPKAPLHILKTIAQNTKDTGILLTNPTSATSGNYAASPSIIMEGKGYTGSANAEYSRARLRQGVVPLAVGANFVPALPYYDWDAYDPSTSSWLNIMELQPRSIGGAGTSGGLAVGSTNSRININTTANQIDDNINGAFTISNTSTNSSSTVLKGGASNANTLSIKWGSNLQTASTYGFSINETASTSDIDAELDVAAAFKGILIPRMTGNKRDSLTSRVVSLSVTSGGSGYNSGASTNVNGATTTNITGLGSGLELTVTLTGGVVTAATPKFNTPIGRGYKIGDQVSVNAIGGSGSGAVLTIASLTPVVQSLMVVDTSTNQLSIHSGTGDDWTGRVVTSSASTLNLSHSADYIFNGSAATYTLPAVNSKIAGRQNEIHIINEGSGSITVNSNSGSTLYTTSLVSTITVAAGATAVLYPTGANFKVKFNQ